MDMTRALATQLANIERRTGKTVAQLTAIIEKSGLTKHGELVAMLKDDHGLGHGDANTLVHTARKSDGASAAAAAGKSGADVVDGIYVGPRTALRPVHDALMAAIARFGPFAIVPTKGYVSLRAKKQFAMIGPATSAQVEVGLNVKGVKGTSRLVEQKPGRMCQYTVRVAERRDVDKELIGWIRRAYDSAQ
jgi:hypothetical protein